MSEKTENAISKYKTLGRALSANDVPACREILQEYTQNMGKELTEEEVFRLGLTWFKNKNGRPIEVAAFLKEIGFDFEVHTSVKDENVGTKLPFRLIDDPEDQNLLVELIQHGYVQKDLTDGAGDSLLVAALQTNQFELADKLLAIGVDINASNIMGQTALHMFAGRLSFQAVEWLGRNGADPTIEDLQNARPSEMVPEHMQGWDPDCMYNVLEDYVERFQKGLPFEINAEFNEMIERERPKEDEDDQTLGDQADEAKRILSSFGV